MMDNGSAVALRSLAPRFDEDQHGVYLRALVFALNKQDDVRNIALTGPYGTGKSSVLEQLIRIDGFESRVLTLSLSTVGQDEPSTTKDSKVNPAARTKTNRIQKEIVKQILYRDAPSRTRGSRFRRISRFDWIREIWVSLGLGALLLAILYLTQLATPIVAVLGPSPSGLAVVAVYVLLFISLAAIVYATRWLTHNRVFLEKLSAGPATVSLSATSSSFFDQYMDEIIYYFEQSGRDILIFEDIDRFEDVHIFETLRSLNTLLNGSDQVRYRRDPARRFTWKRELRPDVKFIYALRDSVFEKLGKDVDGHDFAEDEVKRANRTKFFDLVIPIVPFITHRNARDLMTRELEGTGISSELINLAAGHVADMRLIRNMRNEYDVYALQLIGTNSQIPGLDPDRLFALILYKSVHMEEFEKIRFGTSALDKLHVVWRQIVDDSIAAARTREREAEAKLAREGIAAARAKQLGDRLEKVAHALQAQFAAERWYLKVNGAAHPAEDWRTPEFWVEIVATNQEVAFVVQSRGTVYTMTAEALQNLIGQSLDVDLWKKIDRREQSLARRAAHDDIDFLRHKGWQDFYARPVFKTTPEEGKGEDFAQAAERLLDSRLARALVANGFLNDYFALFISVYYGDHLRRDALNYVVHALDEGRADINYELDEDDIEAIIVDKGTAIFRDRAVYNISILDHLLKQRASEAKEVITLVAAWDPVDREFADQYLQAGTEQVRFIQILAPRLPAVLNYLTVAQLANPELVAILVDAALDYADEDMDYVGLESLNEYVISNFRSFPSLKAQPDEEPVHVRKSGTVNMLANFGIRLPDTSPLGPTARKQVLALGTYDLTARNLEDLTDQESLALDVLAAKNKAVYNVALERIDDYLAVIEAEGNAVTVDDPQRFLEVLTDVDKAAPGNAATMSKVVRRAREDCRIEDLSEAPQSAWPALSATKRTAPSAQNLLAYVDFEGSVDENIAALLTDTQAILEIDDVAMPERLRLALAVLDSDAIQPLTQRVDLARSLDLDAPLQSSLLTPRPGNLPGLLIKAGLLADDSATFMSPLLPDWSTKEFAMSQSTLLAKFLSPVILDPAELQGFFTSTLISSNLKDLVIANIAEYAAGASTESIRAAAKFASSRAASLNAEAIELLQEGGSEDTVIVELLANSSLSIDELRASLRMLGHKYAEIADYGKGRPTFPDDSAHIAVLDRLQAAGIVSNHRPEEGKGKRRVTLKQHG